MSQHIAPPPSGFWNGLAAITRIFSPLKAGLWLCVIIPTLVTLLYQGLIASDIYVSESAFSVRSEQAQAASMLGSLLPGAGATSAQQDQLTVNTFIRSRGMIDMLLAQTDLKAVYRNSNADWFARLPDDVTQEELVHYYRAMVTILYDERALISELEVRAFTADEAQALNEAILEQSELFVNNLSAKIRADSITFAREQVTIAEQELAQANATLSSFREKNRNFDPAASSAGTTGLIQALEGKLAEKRAERDAASGVMTARNAQMRNLNLEIAALQRQIAAQTATLTAGKPGSMTRQIEDYASAALKQEFAAKRYGMALAALEAAQAEAGRKSIYLTRVVPPSLPDEAVEPRRLYRIASVFFLSLAGYGLLLLIAASVRDHIRR